MNRPNKIVVVRHGQSEGNVASPEDISFFDKPNHAFCLTAKGREQAQKTGEYLRKVYGEFDAYFCSTLARTQETMSLLYPDAKPITDSRLNEMMRGAWHTLPKPRLLEIYPDEQIIRDREGEYHYRPPSGQSCQDVEALIYSFLADLRTDFSGKNILIAGHGNWMLVFWRLMLNRLPQEYEERYRHDKYENCALAVFENVNDEMVLTQDNIIIN